MILLYALFVLAVTGVLLAFALAVHDGELYAGTCEPGPGEAGATTRPDAAAAARQVVHPLWPGDTHAGGVEQHQVGFHRKRPGDGSPMPFRTRKFFDGQIGGVVEANEIHKFAHVVRLVDRRKHNRGTHQSEQGESLVV